MPTNTDGEIKGFFDRKFISDKAPKKTWSEPPFKRRKGTCSNIDCN